MELIMKMIGTNWFVCAGIAWLLCFIILTCFRRSKLNPKRLPPGPFPMPLLGNIFSLIGDQPHKSLGKLANSYGPVMSLQLGLRTAVVVSSASAAKEVLQTKDAFFANRSVPDAVSSHWEYSVGLRPADARWRYYRKICATQVFSKSKLDVTRALRKRKVQDLLSHVQECCKYGKAVDIGLVIFTTSLNFLSNTFFSIDLADSNSILAREFKILTTKVAVEAAKPNIGDFFPMLKALDPQGIRKRATAIIAMTIKLFDTIIDQRLESRQFIIDSSADEKDVLDALLSLTHENNEFQLKDVKHFFFELFGAGTDTTSTTIEWAMAELLRNPKKLKNAQIELEEVIGKGKVLEEEDVARLPYLEAVIKETLRMHPPLPFLVPRTTFEDTTLCGFTVPKNTLVIVNAYAIGKNPSLWPNPDSFEPERFLGSSVDFHSHNFEYIPFGSGRRICAGMPLANRIIPLMLGSLIHSFNWSVERGVASETLNMEELFGLTLHKAKPVYAIPLPKY